MKLRSIINIRNAKIHLSTVGRRLNKNAGSKMAGKPPEENPVTFLVLQKHFRYQSVPCDLILNIKPSIISKYLPCHIHIGHGPIQKASALFRALPIFRIGISFQIQKWQSFLHFCIDVFHLSLENHLAPGTFGFPDYHWKDRSHVYKILRLLSIYQQLHGKECMAVKLLSKPEGFHLNHAFQCQINFQFFIVQLHGYLLSPLSPCLRLPWINNFNLSPIYAMKLSTAH